MIDFKELHIQDNGNDIVIYVSKDAAKDANGVRFAVSFSDTLKYAKENDALPLTSKISDLIYINANQKLNPCPRPISASYASQTSHSLDVDKQIKTDGIVADPCKDWILDNLSIKGDSCNYGWHISTNSNSWRGIKVFPTKINAIKVIQPAAIFHKGIDHKDYSQCLRLIKRDCIINGKKDDVISVIQLSTVLSYEKIKYEVISKFNIGS